MEKIKIKKYAYTILQILLVPFLLFFLLLPFRLMRLWTSFTVKNQTQEKLKIAASGVTQKNRNRELIYLSDFKERDHIFLSTLSKFFSTDRAQHLVSIKPKSTRKLEYDMDDINFNTLFIMLNDRVKKKTLRSRQDSCCAPLENNEIIIDSIENLSSSTSTDKKLVSQIRELDNRNNSSLYNKIKYKGFLWISFFSPLISLLLIWRLSRIDDKIHKINSN